MVIPQSEVRLKQGAGVALAAVFLDRDGVLNANRDDHVKCWEEFRFIPGALAAARLLANFGVPVIVITNQAIINRGIVSQQMVEMIHTRMRSQIVRAGGRIDRILYCPHSTDDQCACRKPNPGLLEQAASELGIDLARSVFVGDALTDIEAGVRAGCRTVLVRTGRGNAAAAGLTQQGTYQPDAIANDLLTAIPVVSELLELAGTQERVLGLRRQERVYEEFTGSQVATSLPDAAFDT